MSEELNQKQSSMLRQLRRGDLPFKATDGTSLHIPVIYKDKLRFVCDVHYGIKGLCYLEDNDGEAVLIDECELIADYPAYIKVRTAMEGTPIFASQRLLNQAVKIKALQVIDEATDDNIYSLHKMITVFKTSGYTSSYDQMRKELIEVVQQGYSELTKKIIDYKY